MPTLACKNFFNGRWETGVTTGISANPSDLDEVVAEYARADRNQTELAIRAAADAVPAWAFSTPQRRADALDTIGHELLARRDELGTLLAREEGKTLPEATGEVARAGQIFKFFAGEALRMGGERLASTRVGVDVEVTREPVGVVGVIAPWNFPFAIPAWKIAPALAFGNSVVFKPAELVPACGWALAEIISRAGLPAGVFSVVHGGREAIATTREVKNVLQFPAARLGTSAGAQPDPPEYSADQAAGPIQPGRAPAAAALAASAASAAWHAARARGLRTGRVTTARDGVRA